MPYRKPSAKPYWRVSTRKKANGDKMLTEGPEPGKTNPMSIEV